MDELVYGDITIHIKLLINTISDKEGKAEKDDFINLLKLTGRTDLLDKLEFEEEE